MNPIFLKIGNIQIYWYSIFILLGMIVGCTIIYKEARKYNIPKKFLENLFFYTILFALIGARLYFVIFEYKQYINNPIDILKVWEGGLAIHGGIIAGLITVIVMCKKNKISILKMTDIIVVGVIIGQAIGRWGNFFNSEAFGPEVSVQVLQILSIPKFIIDGMYFGSCESSMLCYHHPTFLYESYWNILGFLLLLGLKESKKLHVGQLTGTYFIFYSVGRFFIESLRQDSLMLFGIIKQAQLISIALIVVGLILIVKNINNKKYSEV
ncbi:MAG: prolipoprotein diacylglyceryl transferase [Clostridium sp.]|nr:prolipoprotein diacylglyceryl transferase [Clostridium sp.]MCM1443754.1 prolipoprotein diacylglyceryl transferase [Candidatus Amulumruptor caecigallinarius]